MYHGIKYCNVIGHYKDHNVAVYDNFTSSRNETVYEHGSLKFFLCLFIPHLHHFCRDQKIVQMFAQRPRERELPSWYPSIGQYDTILKRLRHLGLYRDEHLVGLPSSLDPRPPVSFPGSQPQPHSQFPGFQPRSQALSLIPRPSPLVSFPGSQPCSQALSLEDQKAYWHVVAPIRLLREVNYVYTSSQIANPSAQSILCTTVTRQRLKVMNKQPTQIQVVSFLSV